MITPSGQGSLMIGTDHVNFNAHFCEKLGFAPYHQNVQKVFGQEDARPASVCS